MCSAGGTNARMRIDRWLGGVLTWVMAGCASMLAGCAGGPTGEGGCPDGAELVPVRVEAGEIGYRDRPVVAGLSEANRPEGLGSWASAGLKLEEVAVGDGEDLGARQVLDDSVPFQLDVLPAEAAVADSVQLVFLLEGRTEPGEVRRYRACVGPRAGDLDGSAGDLGRSAGALSRSAGTDRVRLAGTEVHEGQESFVVRTDSAEYVYHRRGAGFASLHDVDGHDWLSYHPGVGEQSGSGSGGWFRGLPNMGYPEGYAHPGEDTSRTDLVADGPLRLSLHSSSLDGKMRIRWDIYPTFARLTVLAMRTPYWFLYEGTPGGALDLETDYWVRSGDEPGTRLPAAEAWTGDLPADAGGEWAYVEDGTLGRILLLAHHTDEAGIDSYRPMNEEMTVFGFGRRDLEKFMTATPNRFSVAFLEKRPPDRLRSRIRSIYDDPQVRVGATR